VTEDLVRDAQALLEKYPDRVRVTTQSKPIPHEQLIREFANSRVYLGASTSDGISTSFLEALIQGAFPIQTNTSCADEWVSKGAEANLPATNSKSIESAIIEALTDDDLVDAAQRQNHLIAKEYLDESRIKEIARTFYSRS
jgi:glycosyltransferase involved in cell wall biosynthesis